MAALRPALLRRGVGQGCTSLARPRSTKPSGSVPLTSDQLSHFVLRLPARDVPGLWNSFRKRFHVHEDWRIWNWSRVRRAVRAARTVSLAMSLYGAGYAKGMHDGLSDPAGVRKEQCMAVLRSCGGVDEQGNMKLCLRDSAEVATVKRVLPRMLGAASEEVRFQEQLLERDEAREPGHRSHRGRREKLTRAKAQLDNWNLDGFVVVDVNAPNAFVHALVPRLIFVQRGLFRLDRLVSVDGASVSPGSSVAVRRPGAGEKWLEGEVTSRRGDLFTVVVQGESVEADARDLRLVETHQVIQSDEQLAMLLGHELSHVIHGHAEDATKTRAVSAGTQLVIFALLDPTGLLSFFVEFGTGLISKYGYQLPETRGSEAEADATGLRICARAGYDPRHATVFFERLLALEHLDGGGVAAHGPTWRSTHPATADRLAALNASEKEAAEYFVQAKLPAPAPAAPPAAPAFRQPKPWSFAGGPRHL